MTFEEFAATSARKVRAALIAAYGPDVGMDAASEAIAYGWENWHRLEKMDSPAGYLYRVGQTAAARLRKPEGKLPSPLPSEIPDFEPGLIPALNDLSESQRVCVVLVHAYGWPQVEVAELLDITPQTVRTHLQRALTRLQTTMEGAQDAN